MLTTRPDVLIDRYRIVVHEAEEGGYWGEVLGLPGCVSQGETEDELMGNMREAIDAVLEAQDDEAASAVFILESSIPNKDTRMYFAVEPETWTTAAGG